MLKMKTVWRDGGVEWQAVLRCDHCHEEISGGVRSHGVFAWEIRAVGALRDDGLLSPASMVMTYEVVTGDVFHLHVSCMERWESSHGGKQRWIAQDIRSLPKASAHALGVMELGELSEAGWWESGE